MTTAAPPRRPTPWKDLAERLTADWEAVLVNVERGEVERARVGLRAYGIEVRQVKRPDRATRYDVWARKNGATR